MPYLPPTVPWTTAEASTIQAIDGGVPVGVDTYITYGTFRFPAPVDLKFQVIPVYDSAGLLPKFYKHVFTIETVLCPNFSPGLDTTVTQPLDLNESQWRRMLAIPGQEFRIFAKGIGQNQRADINSSVGVINVAPGNNRNQDPVIDSITGNPEPVDVGTLLFIVENGKDMNFGPRPQVQVLEPIGSSRTFRLVWTVEVCLPICCITYQFDNNHPVLCFTPSNFTGSNRALRFNLTEFSYSVSWMVGEEGFTDRTVNGSVEVAGTLQQNLNRNQEDIAVNGPKYTVPIIDAASARNLIVTSFPYLPGFSREIFYDLSRDGRILEFRILDREFRTDTPMFEGIIKANGKARLRNTDGMAFVNWDFVISGEFTVLAGVPKWKAYIAFLILVRSRMLRLLNNQQFLVRRKNGEHYQGITSFLPVSHEYEEDLLGRSARFQFRYRLISSLSQVLEDTNMFRPVESPLLSQEAWINGVPNSLKQGMGTTALGLVSPRPLQGGCSTLQPTRADTPPIKPIEPPRPTPIFYAECPEPANSWREYKNWFEVYDERQYVHHSPTYKLPKTYFEDSESLNQPNPNSGYPGGLTSGMDIAAMVLGPISPAYPTFQGLGASHYYVRMRGYAVRLCYQIKPPSLYRVNCIDNSQRVPTQIWSKMVLDRVIGSHGKIRTIFSSWDIWYTIPVPANPNVNFIASLVTNAEGEQYVSIFNPKGLEPNLNQLSQIPQ